MPPSSFPIEPPEDVAEPSPRLQWIGLALFALVGVIAILVVTTGDHVPVATLPR